MLPLEIVLRRKEIRDELRSVDDSIGIVFTFHCSGFSSTPFQTTTFANTSRRERKEARPDGGEV